MLLLLSFRTEEEKEKFEFVYNRYKKLLLHKAFDILRDYSLAQDATSEAFIRVYKNLNKLDDDLESGRTAAFLVMIVKNVSITMLKKRNRNESIDMEEFERPDSFNLEQSIISQNDISDLLKLVDQLKEELKTPFLLKYAYDLSYKEISKLLKISENNVAVRINRAKNKLPNILRKGGISL